MLFKKHYSVQKPTIDLTSDERIEKGMVIQFLIVLVKRYFVYVKIKVYQSCENPNFCSAFRCVAVIPT